MFLKSYEEEQNKRKANQTIHTTWRQFQKEFVPERAYGNRRTKNMNKPLKSTQCGLIEERNTPDLRKSARWETEKVPQAEKITYSMTRKVEQSSVCVPFADFKAHFSFQDGYFQAALLQKNFSALIK